MPVEIDIDQRLATIADATLEIVAADGLDGISIRAVAKRIGGSTTLVTNYLPTREALLRNAIEHAMKVWDAELDEALEGVAASKRLAAMSRWSCSTSGNDQVLRRLFLEVLGRSGPGSDAMQAIRGEAGRNRDWLVGAAGDAGASDAAFAADVLHLVFRGFYVSSLEDPELWTDDRMNPLIDRLVRFLTTAH